MIRFTLDTHAMSQSALMTVMTAAARKAAKGIVRDFGEIDKLQISKKGAANFVTNADTRTDKILIEELSKARPKFSFLTEESGVIAGPDKKTRFVIDPIDGTTNFIHAIPYISVSIALQTLSAKGEWETTAGVVYDPIHDEMFTAETKQGAFLNGARIRASTRREDLLVSTTAPRKTRAGFEKHLAVFSRVVAEDITVRCSGSAALDLAYVAAGRLDAMWYPRLNNWDMVAGALIVKEANGMVTALDGTSVITDGKGSVLATNGLIHKKLQTLLAA